MALDYPTRVTAAAAFDVVPTGDVWARADAQLALIYWHWSFLAQPAPLPERLINADPGAFFDYHVRVLGIGRTPGRYPEELISVYRDLLDDPSVVEAICEDYRAGATIDREHDDADLGNRKIQCPLLLLWSGRGALPRLYGDVLDVWRPWAEQVTGRGLDATHFLVEDQPEEVAAELLALLSSRPPSAPSTPLEQPKGSS
jgi:haloacetate dehalogenase